MRMDRRKFIKLAGLSVAAGLGGIKVADGLIEAAQYTSKEEAKLGQRWAMVVDVSKLRSEVDYARAIRACHEAHNVPDIGNLKDEVKWLWKDEYEHVFPGTEHDFISDYVKETPFLVLCNHCTNPPCVRVCPTKATFKRPDGIVAMDYHRCIGCRFCMAGCPFGARSFNWRDPRPFIKKENREFPTRTKGVVEKCNFCVERLAKGLEPACVEALKETGAMVFGDLKDPNSKVREILRTHYTVRRKPELGTSPNVYYVIGGK